MTRRIKLIINPISGLHLNREGLKFVISKVLNQYDCVYQFQQTERPGDAFQFAKNAIEGKYDIVAAVGGDGTVNEVASALVHSNVPLGIIPIGSGNALARGLEIPMQFKQAIQNLISGQVRKIDVGQMQGRYFFATAGAGFEAVVGKQFNEGPIRGPLPYIFCGLHEFLKYEPQDVFLKFDHQVVRKKALLVSIANTRQLGNGAIIAPHAAPDDGLLDVCIIDDINILQALFNLPRLFTGLIDNDPYTEFYRASNFEIIRPQEAPIHLDGETLDGDKNFNVSLLPKALNVIVPASHQNEKEN